MQEYLDNMKEIQSCLLEFIDNGDAEDENLNNLLELLRHHKILNEKNDFEAFLQLLVAISNNHHRFPNFFNKIFQILRMVKDDINNKFSNIEILNIFESSKRVLLFLLDEKIAKVDQYFLKSLQTKEYIDNKFYNYFFVEFGENKAFTSKSKEEIERLKEERKIGENAETIACMIREDSIEEFITYMNKKSISVNQVLPLSFFETNEFLIDKTPSLIEYSAFFGSFQIFKYLILNKANINPSVWFYAIHGSNPELIHYLEEMNIVPEDKTYKECIEESIKCHNNELIDYFENKYFNINEQNMKSFVLVSLKYYNYRFIKTEFIEKSQFYDICKLNYIKFIELILKNEDVDLNVIYILNLFYLYTIFK